MSTVLIEDLQGKHKNNTCYIIGKGKSINKLTVFDFKKDSFIITINQANTVISKLNLNIPIYAMYKDGDYNPKRNCRKSNCTDCWIELFLGNILLVHKYHSFNCKPNYPNRVIFDNTLFGLRPTDFSQQSAIRCAEVLGASNLVFYGFDSINNNNYENIFNKKHEDYLKQAERMKTFNYRLPYVYK